MLDLSKLNERRKKLNFPKRPLVSSTRKPLDFILEPVYGKIPEDIYGHVFVNSSSGSVNSPYPYPKKHPDGSDNQEYGSPLLLGGGYVMRLDFEKKGKVRFKGKLLKPPAFYADCALKYGSNSLFPKWAQSLTAFKNLGVSRISFWLGFNDLLSTAITPIRYGNDTRDRLVATTDVGRPYEFDPKTLNIKTPIGWLKEYINSVPGIVPWPLPVLQTTAHPAFDPTTKELFSVNYTKALSMLLKESHLWPVLHLHHDSIEKDLEKKVKDWDDIDDSNEARKKLNDYFHNLHRHHRTQEGLLKRIGRKIIHGIGRLFGKIGHILGIPKNEFSISNEVYLHRFNGGDTLETWRIVDDKGKNLVITQCCHQTSISKNYFVFIDSAFKISLDVMFNNPFPHNYAIDRFIRKHMTVAQEPFTDVYIVDRKELIPSNKTVVAKQLRLEPEFIHCSLNYENPHDQLTLYGASNSAACLAEWVRPYDKLADGNPIEKGSEGIIATGAMDIGRIGKYVIDGKTGELVDGQSHLLHETGNLDKIHEDMGPHTWGVGIYTYRDIISGEKPVEEITDIYFQCYGLEHRRLTHFIFELYKKYSNRIIPAEEVKKLCEIQIPNQLTRLNTETFKLEDYYQFPQGYEIRSLQFTHRKTSKGNRPGTDGYITVLMINEDGNNFFREVWIFDAARLKEGPVCILTHPELNYAFTLHSVWTSDLESNPENGYKVDMIEDYTNMINKIWLDKKKVKSFFEEKVFPHVKKNAQTNSECE